MSLYHNHQVAIPPVTRAVRPTRTAAAASAVKDTQPDVAGIDEETAPATCSLSRLATGHSEYVTVFTAMRDQRRQTGIAISSLTPQNRRRVASLRIARGTKDVDKGNYPMR